LPKQEREASIWIDLKTPVTEGKAEALSKDFINKVFLPIRLKNEIAAEGSERKLKKTQMADVVINAPPKV
jgi:hypothetical protein